MNLVKLSDSQVGATLPPKGYYQCMEIFLVIRTQRAGERMEDDTDISWEETRDASEHSTMNKKSSQQIII